MGACVAPSKLKIGVCVFTAFVLDLQIVESHLLDLVAKNPCNRKGCVKRRVLPIFYYIVTRFLKFPQSILSASTLFYVAVACRVEKV